VGAAGVRRGRWAWAGRGLAAAPRLPLVAGALLGLAALLELATRTTVTSSVRATQGLGAPIQTLVPNQTLEIGNTVVSPQGAMVIYVLALAATLLPALLPPVTAAVAVCVANVLSLGLFHTVTFAGGCALIIVAYRLGRSGSRLLAPGVGVPFLVFALAGANPSGSEAGVVAVLSAALAPATALAGLARRARSEAAAHSMAQEVIASTLLEHTARGERARIARELHDVVAHHISMIAVQAETARLATPGMPDSGARRLLEIGDTARAALTEMRRLLGVLREDARDTGPERRQADNPSADRRPQPGLQQVNELLDEARSAAGTGLRLIVSGSPATLDPGVELAAYRIIQEALTNARRHAPGAAVDVELHYEPDTLRLRVRDNGPGAPAVAPVAGHGLLGMRERAAAVGGRLRTGPADPGGYLVEATLPAKAEVVV
jgi:signal transduction histidine kinase